MAHNKHFGIVLNVFDVVGIVVDSVDVRISVRFKMPLPRRLRYSECFSMLILSKDYGELKKNLPVLYQSERKSTQQLPRGLPAQCQNPHWNLRSQNSIQVHPSNHR